MPVREKRPRIAELRPAPSFSRERMVTSCLTPPSSVEMELSMIPLTISFRTKRAKDQMLRWATAIVLPSSSISATRDVTVASSGAANVAVGWR